VASLLGIGAGDVAVCSTGLIGIPLPVAPEPLDPGEVLERSALAAQRLIRVMDGSDHAEVRREDEHKRVAVLLEPRGRREHRTALKLHRQVQVDGEILGPDRAEPQILEQLVAAEIQAALDGRTSSGPTCALDESGELRLRRRVLASPIEVTRLLASSDRDETLVRAPVTIVEETRVVAADSGLGVGLNLSGQRDELGPISFVEQIEVDSQAGRPMHTGSTRTEGGTVGLVRPVFLSR